MAELGDVYGANYQQDIKTSRINNQLNIISNNLANRQFTFKLTDSKDLWHNQSNGDLDSVVISQLIQRTMGLNNQLRVFHLRKNTKDTNVLPVLLIDTPVEYFMIIDNEMNRCYLIYMTPSQIGAF